MAGKKSMMADLAVRIRTQTAELTKGLKEAATGIKSFTSQSATELKKFSAGVNREISGMLNSISPVFGRMYDMFSSKLVSGLLSFGNAAKATGVQVAAAFAMATAGITLIIAGLVALIDYLKNTKEGWNIINTGINVFKGLAGQAIDLITNFYKTLWNLIQLLYRSGEVIVAFLTGNWKGAGAALVKLKSEWNELKTAVSNTVDSAMGFGDATERGLKVAKLQREIKERELTLNKELNEIDYKIAQNREKILNKSLSSEERAKALAEIDDLILKKSEKQIEFKDLQIETQKALNSLGNSGYEDLKKVADLEAEKIRLLTDQQELTNGLVRRRNEIASAAEREAKAQKEISDSLAAASRQAGIGPIEEASGLGRDARGVQQQGPLVSGDQMKQKAEETNKAIAKQGEHVAWLTSAWKGLGDMVENTVGGAFTGFADLIAASLSSGQNALQSFGEFFKRWAVGLITKMIGMIAAALILTALLSALGLGGTGGLKAAGEGMKFGAALKDNLGLLGGFAAGGTASQSGFYRVGERGAETVFLPKGASVANAHETQRMMDNKPGVIAETAIRGEDLRILLKNVERKQNNTR